MLTLGNKNWTRKVIRIKLQLFCFWVWRVAYIYCTKCYCRPYLLLPKCLWRKNQTNQLERHGHQLPQLERTLNFKTVVGTL